jgi:hypothetical protein
MSYDNPKNDYEGYNAISVDKGVLLFSRTDKGFKLFHDYMSLYMDNLYNPLCNNTYFNLHYVESNDPSMREKCDIALKFPEKHLPLKIPVKDECFTDTDVLKNSLEVKTNSWEPTPEQIQRITDYVVGVHIPVRRDTFDISTLQEMAEGISYNRVLMSGVMSEFKYEKEFLELAQKMDKCTYEMEARKIAKEMTTLASDIMKRDYPDMRKEYIPDLIKGDNYSNTPVWKDEGYNAIETDRGVLLFSRTKEGEELFKNTISKYFDNIYNPECKETYLNIHYLECKNGTLKGQCDLEIKFPALKQSEFPVDQCFFANKSVLKYSMQEDKFNFTPDFRSVEDLHDHSLNDDYMPINISGDTCNISVLQKIAVGKGPYQSLAILGLGGFKYNADFKELADLSLSYSGHIHHYKVIDAMKEKANEILDRDYPNIKKGSELTEMNKNKIDLNPPHKKKGIGL